MPLLVLIALLLLPFAEIWTMILVGQQVGAAVTVAALLVTSAVGVLVMRAAGMRVLRDVDDALRTGMAAGDPAVAARPTGVLDPLMLLVGGILLAIPGFITGAVGLLLALPVTRPVLRWAFAAWAHRRLTRLGATMAGDDAVTVDATVVNAPTDPDPARGPQSPPRQVVQGRVVDETDDRDAG